MNKVWSTSQFIPAKKKKQVCSLQRASPHKTCRLMHLEANKLAEALYMLVRWYLSVEVHFNHITLRSGWEFRDV